MILLSPVTGPVIGAIGSSVVGGGGFLVGSFFARSLLSLGAREFSILYDILAFTFVRRDF